MQQLNVVCGDRASLANIRGSGDRLAPGAEIPQREALAYFRCEEPVPGDNPGLFTKREAKLARNPAIRVEERRGRNADPPKKLKRGDAAFSELAGNM